jgi:hypothetical protein
MKKSAQVSLIFLSLLAAAAMNGCGDDAGDWVEASAASTITTSSSRIGYAMAMDRIDITIPITTAATVTIGATVPTAADESPSPV